MKIPRIANAMGHIEDDLVSGAARGRKKKKSRWVKWGSLAACFAVLVVAGAVILTLLPGEENVNPGRTEDRYKDFQIQVGESGIGWPWEYQTVYEQYTELTVEGISYDGKGRAVSETLVGEWIGTHTVAGYDEITSKKYTRDFEVYRLKHARQSQFVAVKMDGAWYIFKNSEYDPPSTLGQLFDLVDLPNAIELGRFSKNGDSPSNEHFVLNSDDGVWEVLADCRDAMFVEDQKWTVGGREYISFSITSETLGVYKVAMYVTADGYLWTNAMDWRYLFRIGEDAAEKIIQYAREHSAKTQFEPYRNRVVGKIVEITDDYILVDDSILCKDPADGITYKILLNDLRISRYVDHEVVAIGDTVQISYEGEIDEQNDNNIDSAISASRVVISGGEILIPE